MTAEAIIELDILIKVRSISPPKLPFSIFTDFMISSTACGGVGGIKMNEGKSFYFYPNLNHLVQKYFCKIFSYVN